MDTVYKYNPAGCESADSKRVGARHTPDKRSPGLSGGQQQPQQQMTNVYVREKIRVESADPSLISLSSKLMYLNNVLGLARRNLEAALGRDLDE